MDMSRGFSRRDFLRLAAGATVAGGAALGLGARAAEAARPTVPLNRIGIQLYSVRDQMREPPEGLGFEATLDAIAEIGYPEVEFAGLYGRTAEQARATIDSLGLKAPSSHEDLLSGNEDQNKQTLERAATLGERWIIHPYYIGATLDDYRAQAEKLNEVGALGQQYGIKAGYHNHDHEFALLEGSYGYKILMDETDPDLVDLELDLYWALDAVADYGNQDARPVALFNRAPGRFKLFHVKDGVPDDPVRDPHFEDVGEGEIDFAPIFAAKNRAGVIHYINERDDAPGDPEGSLGSAEDMYDNLVAEYGARRR